MKSHFEQVHLARRGSQADNDFALFYNNLLMLCHDQDQLTTLQASEKVWRLYLESVAKATHAAWPDGSGALGFATQVQLSLVRDRTRELHEIYGLNWRLNKDWFVIDDETVAKMGHPD